ncbi:hypothetical protein Bxe_C0842 [Paraburkholderia xenovorans LB400]|uniref:Uncharacterized protein n=1 Tax=Paraburkholderia xenovorans (strain LB400) TaxID=266265 RepID=Q13GR8_PARXL|nr:hypothetical protein Bxe_C0842 [Paraburkholderia xenovorans LB400]
MTDSSHTLPPDLEVVGREPNGFSRTQAHLSFSDCDHAVPPIRRCLEHAELVSVSGRHRIVLRALSAPRETEFAVDGGCRHARRLVALLLTWVSIQVVAGDGLHCDAKMQSTDTVGNRKWCLLTWDERAIPGAPHKHVISGCENSYSKIRNKIRIEIADDCLIVIKYRKY